MSDVVMVLGMHRSGTSAVSGTLMKLGGGAPKHLMAANAGNPRGYFESDVFVQFHDELLASAGSEWSDWRLFNPGWYRSPAAAGFRRRAKDLFAQEFDGSPLPVLKDPRVCRFAPFWLEALREMQATPHIVMPVRSPLDVARSLSDRDGLSLTHGLLLWLRHVLDAEAHSRREARSIFTWRDFRADWRGVCDKIGAETKLSWSRQSDRAAREIERFLTKELVHHETDDAALLAHGDVHEWTIRAYEALLELARNPLSNSALATLDDVRALLDQSGKLFGRLLIDKEVDLEESRGHAHAAAGERDALQTRQNEILAEKAAALAELAARAEQAERAREDAMREKEGISQTLAAVVAERDALQQSHGEIVAALQARQQELGDKAAALAELAARVEQAERAREDAMREKDGISQTLAAVVAERDALQQSHGEIVAALQARQQELSDKAAALAELAARAEKAERAGEDAIREKEGISQTLAAVVAERDALQQSHGEIVAALQAHQQELGDRATALAELAARAEQAERAGEDAVREKEGLSHSLAAALAERDALHQAHGETSAELQSRQRELAEFADLAEEIEAALGEAEHEKLELSQSLAAAAAQRDALQSSHGEIEAQLQSQRQELTETAAALAGLAVRAEQAEQTGDDLAREREALSQRLAESAAAQAASRRERIELAEKHAESLAALDLARTAQEKAHVELVGERDQARQESQGLAGRVEQVSAELQRARDLAGERATALAEGRSAHEAQIRAQRAELVDAEAALARARAGAARKGVAAWLASAGASRRRLASRLLRSGLFDAEFYRAQNPEALPTAGAGAKGDLAAAQHYVDEGFCRGYRANPLFDTRWYLERYEDVRRSGVNPLLHYLLYGWCEGRDPGPGFQTEYYLEANPDVRAVGGNPLAHYLRHGRHEGRLPARSA